MKSLPGPVLADVAANVLAMTLMVLIALGRMISHQAPAPPPETLMAVAVPPTGGATAVEILRQRLLPGTLGLVDLGPEPPDDPANVSVLLILDPAHYAKVTSTLVARGEVWQELTVPQALKTDANLWHPDFLDLATVATDSDRFRLALQDLLARRAGMASASGALGGDDRTGATLRFPRWFQAALELFGLAALCLAFWALFWLRRWAVRV